MVLLSDRNGIKSPLDYLRILVFAVFFRLAQLAD